MSRIDQKMGPAEVAAVVCTTLEAQGIRVVLCGGAVVSIYSDNEFESYDLDLVPVGLASKVDAAMRSLGFEKQQRHWIHPRTRYWVEFPPGPVQVGDTVVKEFGERRTDVGTVRLLLPTDCVMDRLAAYIHWDDLECLEQAVAVARRHPIDLKRIKRWSVSEGRQAEEKLQEFLARVEVKSPDEG